MDKFDDGALALFADRDGTKAAQGKPAPDAKTDAEGRKM